MNTNIYSDETLLALEEVNAVYEMLSKRYPDVAPVVMASLLTNVIARIESNKTLFTPLEISHRNARIWHPKHGFGEVKGFDEQKKALVKFDNQNENIKVLAKSLILSEHMEDPGPPKPAVEEVKSIPNENIGGLVRDDTQLRA